MRSCFHVRKVGERPNVIDKPVAVGEAFGGGFGWKYEVADLCEIAWKRNTLKCGG